LQQPLGGIGGANGISNPALATPGAPLGLGGLNGLGSTNGVNPQFRSFNEAVFRLSGGPNIPSIQPARILPNAVGVNGSGGFLSGLAGIAEAGGRDPLTGEFGGALGPIAGLLRQASVGTALNLRGIV
jgi:hypothetical protein